MARGINSLGGARGSFHRPGSAFFRVAGRARNLNSRNLGIATMKTRAGRAGTVIKFRPGTIASSVVKSMKLAHKIPGKFRSSTRRGLRPNI